MDARPDPGAPAGALRTAQPAGAQATQLRAVQTLTAVDVVQLSSGRGLFQVMSVERSSPEPGARCRVMLRALGGVTLITLVTTVGEMVFAVPRGRPAA